MEKRHSIVANIQKLGANNEKIVLNVLCPLFCSIAESTSGDYVNAHSKTNNLAHDDRSLMPIMIVLQTLPAQASIISSSGQANGAIFKPVSHRVYQPWLPDNKLFSSRSDIAVASSSSVNLLSRAGEQFIAFGFCFYIV